MGALSNIEEKINLLNKRFARCVLPRDIWTPADEAVYKPLDLLRVPIDEARAMQLKAINYAFTRHYTLNDFYRKYCDMRGITPEDVKTYDDLEKIPLIPDLTFKQHPSGVDFANWIASIYTGELPTVFIDPNPSFDDVVNAFNAAGLLVAYSSGTSGRHTVIPRDMRTYMVFQYASAKILCSLSDAIFADHSLLLYPKLTQTNLWIARVMANQSEIYNDLHYAMDFKISADLTLKAMTDTEQRESTPPSAEERQQKILNNTIKWLERYEKTPDSIRLDGPPFLIIKLMDALEQEGKYFEFGERGRVGTGGGWKLSEDKRIPYADFRKRVDEVLGIPETQCLDHYGMIERNGTAVTCPEGHYFHIPCTWMKPLVLDKNFMPADYGEWGRFAFLDGLAYSYPGFIITGDRVRMLEHCPVCDRPGPVLEQEVQRAPSQEIRGCAEEVRRVLAQDFEGR
ncbi:MAG: LuxE/PaaK family acyltransferase [Halobacteriota archaeon]